VATISTRLTNAGTLLVNGTIDEVSFSNTTPSIYNLATYSQSLTNSVWSSITRATITGTTYLAPDGTYTASKMADTAGNGSGYLRRYYPISSGKTYTYSVYAKAGEWNYAWIVNFTDNAAFAGDYVNFNLSTGTLATNSNTSRMLNPTIVSVGNGWYRISVAMTVQTMTVEATGGIIAVGPSIDAYGGTGPGDGTSGIYIWGVQVELGNTASIYQGITTANTLIAPIWSVKTVPSTVYARGQFDEVTYNSTAGISAINNILTYSQQFAAGWSSGNVTSTSNAGLAPDGSQTANKLTENTANNRHIINIGRPVAAGALQSPYTFSAYAKADTRGNIQLVLKEYQSFVRQASAIFNVSTGTIGTTGGFNGATLLYSNIADVGGGWYRCAMTVNLGSTETQIGSEILIANSSSVSSYTGDGTSSIYVWGAQTEASNVATVYQGVTTGNTLISPNFARREDRTGNMYVTNSYDEFTGAPVVDNSLLWWFDGGQTTSYSGSGAQIRNLSNTAQTGTMYGNVTYSSVDGGKFVFTDYLDTTNNISAGNIGYPASVNDPWTMEAWIYVPTGATWSINNNVGPLYIRGSYNGTHGLVRMQADNTVAVWLRGNTTALAYRTGVTTRDRWNQVVGVWTGGAGGNLQCYVNGTLTQASTTTQDDPLKSTLFYAIGAANTGLSNNSGAVFVGNISSTKLYNRALTADEVAQNYNALRRRYNI
jgi:hypothetical protein